MQNQRTQDFRFEAVRGNARKAFLALLSLLLATGLVLAPFPEAARYAYATDGLVIAIDVGHGQDPRGLYDPGASGNGVEEATANWEIANACADELRTYSGVTVVFTTQYAGTGSLQARVKSGTSQGADVVISFHCNSAGNSAGASSANGSEVWVPNSSAYLYNETHVAGKNLGNRILANLSSLGFANRGVKTRDCTDGEYYPAPGGLCDWYGINYWSRWSGILGIIIEHGFLTNPSDASKLSNTASRTAIGQADARAIAEYYGLSKVPVNGGAVPDADVQRTGEEVVTNAPSLSHESDPAIMGRSLTTVDEMVAWYRSKSKTYPSGTYTKYGAANIEDFCKILLEEAQAEGVRAEVVFSQAMKETGWLQFGGQVKPDQCNFAGIGAVDGGAAGADFSSNGSNSVRIGLRAQVQHLKAYASKDALNQACVDPRFHLVTRGVAPTVNGLTGRWATATDYGAGLTKLVNELLGNSETLPGPVAVKFSLADVPSSLVSGSSATVYVDGVAKTARISGGYATVDIDSLGTHSIVMYEYKGDVAADPHAAYPTAMHTWLAVGGNGKFSTKRYYGLENLTSYAGSSIRITGNKGIRMITGMSQNVKNALASGNLAGYTVEETGTLLAWSDRVSNGSLTIDTEGASRGKAYVRGVKNPVFTTGGGLEYYTNVLVGFNSAEQYKRDMAMRPYVILSNSAGEKFVVYGGTVHRSVGYIAEQNADAFAPGTAAYDFVHGIIDACRG